MTLIGTFPFTSSLKSNRKLAYRKSLEIGNTESSVRGRNHPFQRSLAMQITKNQKGLIVVLLGCTYSYIKRLFL